MCGIFGLVVSNNLTISSKDLTRTITNLFRFSATRGREAAGLAINPGGSIIHVLKKAISPYDFVNSTEYHEFLSRCLDVNEQESNHALGSLSIIGHSRLVTNGFATQDHNNQPIVIPEIVGIHNGIITNTSELWKNNSDLRQEYEVDTEVLLKLFLKNHKSNKSIEKSTSELFSQIQGSASLAFLLANSPEMVLATNTGALFFLTNKNKTIFAFASERYILHKLVKLKNISSILGKGNIQQLDPSKGLKINLNNMEIKSFDLNKLNSNMYIEDSAHSKIIMEIIDYSKSPKNLKRCKKCVLPETYPFIDFDEEGICRYCRRYKNFKVKGEEKLLEEVDKYRRKDGKPDCIVALSGGRDSCYGLHYIKKKLGMNPIAFTYDWGFVTDLARRNCARICGELGIEHIIRTPDISVKRRYVRKNIQAWLKRPQLGMVPLFMAGDKAFYYYARKLRKETGVNLVFFCAGNMMEDCPYKFGFSGIRDGEMETILTKLKFRDKIQLIYYYAKEFLLNPSYLNESILDTAAAYWHTFISKDDFMYLYHYLDWNEENIVNTIIDEYGWEKSKDTKTTWRIGDGTAAFYNYIYYTMAGFTEDDDMLSNMVRAKHLTRNEALKRSQEYSKPRVDSLIEYCQMLGLSFEEIISKINKAKRLY